ncbi:MAG TPA: FmdB family transcriptional regulator [Opitutaceae bacterium]|jgi:hypothetical protein
MPIYEYYCPDNHRIYQFFAKTFAQGQRIPKCPDNPKFRMEKLLSAFSVTSRRAEETAGEAAGAEAGATEDPRLDSAMASMEQEFSQVDENDPRAMGRMMRRMAELTGEKIDGEMEEVVRKLEEGADPDSLEEQLGGDGAGAEGEEGLASGVTGAPKDAGKKERRLLPCRGPRVRDPQLYDYE